LIQIDGIPSQFFIAVAAIEVLLKSKNKSCVLEVFREDLADHLVTFLTKHQLTPILKELLFHLLAKVLRRNYFDFKMILQPRVECLLQSILVEINSVQRHFQSHQTVPTYMQSLFELIVAWIQTFPIAKGKNSDGKNLILIKRSNFFPEYVHDTFLQEAIMLLEVLTRSTANQCLPSGKSTVFLIEKVVH